jgi:hypothetical protein
MPVRGSRRFADRVLDEAAQAQLVVWFVSTRACCLLVGVGLSRCHGAL